MRSEIFNSIEAWIRHGQLQKAARIVRQLSIEEDLSRPDQLRLARLARRALIPLVGVQLLRPWIRPSARSSARATPEEKIEFAACLINYGAWAEGVDVLRRLEPRDHPEVLLFQSFALFSQWDYESALPLLRQYVAHPEVTGYTRLVGLANLAAALVHERIEGEAEALLGELEDQTRSQGHDLLLGHILEFRAELDIHLGNLDAADRHLASALEHARSRNVTRDLLFLRKWSAVADLSRSPENEAARRGLMRVREAAVSADQYETVRDCDYHFARIVRQGEAGLRLYWGSPFEAYRNRFLRDCSWIRERLSERFTLEIPAAIQAEAESLFELDLGSGYSPQRSYVLEPGQKMLGLLGLLVNDSYKPKRVVDLFCGIYPGEHFHPETSHDRVHQLIRRLRKELRLPCFLGKASDPADSSGR
jgi:hypothetical protein